MDETADKSSLGWGWFLIAFAAVVLAALAYAAVPALHQARIDAGVQKLIALATHSEAQKPPVVVVAEDRHMDPHFESDLRGFVPSSTQISVTALAGDREALAFAQEIATWLRSNGWQHVQGASEHKPRIGEHLTGTNLQINHKTGGMELIVGPRHETAP
jgi:hypothetical protein